MASNMYWSIPVLESRGFPKAGELFSMQWAATTATQSHESSRTAPAGAGEFLVTRKQDKYSNLLMHICVDGQSLPLVYLWNTARKDRRTILTVSRFAFKGCYISGMNLGGYGDVLYDSVTISFDEAKQLVGK